MCLEGVVFDQVMLSIVHDLSLLRFFSKCQYVPKVLNFSNRFDRSASLRIIKGVDELYRLEFRLGYLYCDYKKLLYYLLEIIDRFNFLLTVRGSEVNNNYYFDEFKIEKLKYFSFN